MNYKEVINHYPDFPKPGIDFIDIIPFMSNKEAFNQLIADIDANTHCPNVVTVEARGFLFAAPLLTQSKLVQNIVPIRKKGKLPYAEGDLRGVQIMKEYGPDTIEIHDDAITPDDVVLIHDDLLATGGTAKAAYKLVQHFHPKKVYMNFIIEITDEGLHGRDEFKDIDLTTLLTI